MSPRILHIVDTLGMGGAETWLMEVLRLASTQRAAQLDFLVTSGDPGLFDEEARALGARIHYVQFGRRNLPAFVRRFRDILKNGRYGVIHDHQAYVSGWHFLAGLGRLPPVRVAHIHNASMQIRENYGVTPLRRFGAAVGRWLVAMFATHIAGTSRQVVTEYGFDTWPYRGIPRLALYCGFDTARFRGDVDAARRSICREFGWPADAQILLFAGRMDDSPDLDQPTNQKNSGFAVSVGIECARRDRRIHMLVAGRPSEALAVLEKRTVEGQVADRFRFAGVRNDIDRLMLGSQLLLFPSRAEGLGMVAVEAQAAGLPVLASTAVPRECVVVPGLVQFLEPAAGVEAWADQALQLIAARRENAAANDRVTSSVFAIGNSTRALLDVYAGGVAA
jgi:glycosyltransferase involved in cell wall biosynthesis